MLAKQTLSQQKDFPSSVLLYGLYTSYEGLQHIIQEKGVCQVSLEGLPLSERLSYSPERKYAQPCGDKNHGKHDKQKITQFLKFGIICHFGSL